jgi:uncharacterized protein YjfI (DUF2170 family)
LELSVITEALNASSESFTAELNGECLVVTSEQAIAYLAACGTQITVEALLFPADKVQDVNALNQRILETHKMIPLTSIGITEVDGQSYYTAFGALSSDSKVESVVEEVSVLFQNIPEILETFAEFLK